MAEFDPIPTNQDVNFDNGFEKLDPLSSNSAQEEAVSSTQDIVEDAVKEDLYNPSSTNEAEPATQNLLDLGEPTPTVTEEVTQSDLPVKTEDSPQPKESWIRNIDPRDMTVLDLIYWRDVKKTGVVFGSLFVMLLSLALFSVLSVVAYLALSLLTVTVSFVVYKKVMAAVQKTSEGHPFRAYLEVEMTLPEDKLHQIADNGMKYIAQIMKEVRRLILVEDMVDSLKFGLMLWVLTYIGAWFNGMTLLILALVGVFSIPKFYETYQVQIDKNVDLIKTQVNKVLSQVKEKLPLPGKKKKEE